MARILITGASRGLCRALSDQLVERGHEVIAAAREPLDLAGLDAAATVALDVTDPESVTSCARAVGPIDILINNAGATVGGPVESVPVEMVQVVFDTNVFGPLRLIQAFLPGMRDRASGMIVNVSSAAARFAPPFGGVYAASKAALESLTEALRFEARHFGVRVVVVEPGAIATEMARRQQRYVSAPYRELEAQMKARAAQHAAAGWGSAAESVAAHIAEVLDSPDPPLRIPIGADAEQLLAQRRTLTDPEWEQQAAIYRGLKW